MDTKQSDRYMGVTVALAISRVEDETWFALTLPVLAVTGPPEAVERLCIALLNYRNDDGHPLVLVSSYGPGRREVHLRATATRKLTGAHGLLTAFRHAAKMLDITGFDE